MLSLWAVQKFAGKHEESLLGMYNYAQPEAVTLRAVNHRTTNAGVL